MENREVIDKYVSHDVASKILCRALSHWQITYHYTRGKEVSELNLENPENGDVMEVLFRNDRIWEIAITRDTEIVRYSIWEEEEDD